jgi:hypothetical protein
VEGIDLHFATGRDKHSDPLREQPVKYLQVLPHEAMRHKLKTEVGHAVYRIRRAIVEPVFGQIKEVRGFRRFSLRGKQNVRHEWRPVYAVSNLSKLIRAGWAMQMA